MMHIIFLWILVKGLTGSYNFLLSGMHTWFTAVADPRIAAAVPLIGVQVIFLCSGACRIFVGMMLSMGTA